jgi:hypothetical protein
VPYALLAESFVERDARLSPDGRLVAYASDENGQPEISIRVIEGGPRREVVSAGGGSQPVWGPDGRELLFVDPEGALRSVPIRRAPEGRPIVGNAARVGFPRIGVGLYGTQYDLSPDGRTVFFLDRQPLDQPRDIGIVLGWRALIKRPPS